MSTTIIAPFRGPHDHNDCLHKAIRDAEERCNSKGLRLTELRRRVLALVWKSHRPQRAYDVLKGLEDYGHRPAPPTAYRALDFLVQAGLIHRIESLNAYIGCPDPGQRHAGQFFICDACDAVAEIQDTTLTRKLNKSADQLGFTPHGHTIEIHGLCEKCSK